MDLNRMCSRCHSLAKEKGFYDDRSPKLPELLMLLVSEAGEALEADRKGKQAKLTMFEDILDRGIVSQEAYQKYFEEYIKDSVEDEIADIAIRLFDMCGYLGINLEEHVEYKLEYNSYRPDKHGKEY